MTIRILLAAMIACGLAFAPAAVSAEAMNKDGMKKGTMEKKDGMSKKDKMGKDGMKKDKMPDPMMKK
jgi:pentapeptide MXKDX repeat protein